MSDLGFSPALPGAPVGPTPTGLAPMGGPVGFSALPTPSSPALSLGPVSFTPPSQPIFSAIPAVGPFAASLVGGGRRQGLDPNLQKNLRSMQRKWEEIGPTIANLGVGFGGAPIMQALVDMDRQRVARGQQPMTRAQTARAAMAMQSGDTPTEKPDRNPLNLLGNAVRDLSSIVHAIPRIPEALVEEVRELPSGLQQASAALGRGDLAGVFRAPGVRMLPGAYIAENLAEGDIGELVTHPVFTALDVMPLAKRAAPRVKRAVEGTRAGDLLSTVGDELAGTKPVQLWNRAFGRQTRGIARQINPMNMALEAVLDPDTYMPHMRWGDSLDDAAAAAEKNAFIQEMGQHTRQASSWIRDYSDEFRVNATRKATLSQWEQMTPEELVFVRRADDLARDVAATVEKYTGEIRSINIPRPDGSAGIEWYDAQTADRIIHARNSAARARTYADLRRAVTSPELPPEEYLRLARDILDTPTASRIFTDDRGIVRGRQAGTLSAAAKRQQADLALTAADMAGLDTRHIRRMLHSRATGTGGQALDPFVATREAIDGLLADDAARAASVRPLVPVEEMVATVRRYSRQWGKAGELTAALRTGNFVEARRIAKSILGNKRATIPELESFIDTLDRYVARDRVLSRTSRFTDKFAARLEKRASDLVARSAPARFREVIVDRAVSELADRITERGVAEGTTVRTARGDQVAINASPETRDAIIQAIMERRYGDLGYADEAAFNAEWFDIRDGISRTWQKMRDELGIEPVFLHRVSPGGAKQIRFPRIGEISIKPSAARASTVDISAHIPDLAIGLTHEGLEFLAREGSEHFARSVADSVGVSKADLIERYAADARRAYELQPHIDYNTHLDRLISRRYTPFNPEEVGFKWKSQRFEQIKAEGTYIPKYIAEAIQDYRQAGPTRLSAAWDPVMKVFRTALLPLSPRWHTNNIFGGGIMAMARTSPRVMADFFRAWRDMRAGTTPEWIKRQLDLTGGQEAKFLAESDLLAGRTLGRLAIESGNLPGNKFVQMVSQRMGRVVSASYAFNQFVDNAYRAAALMYGERSALRKGLSAGEARLAGVELMHKIMPEWSAMTALERSIMRQVFPFYAFVGHMMRYVRQYPVDHPVRASIMGTITRTELEDLGTGLPESFMSIFRFGKVDEFGNQKAFSVGAMNPFRDVPSHFTVLGWASAMNPMLTTVAEQLGFRDGRVEAYPQLTLDPATGQLVAKQPSFFGSLITNTLPQVELLGILTGSSEDFREALKSNPEAAMTRLYNLTGIPITNFRGVFGTPAVNVQQQAARTELNVAEAQTLERNRALKSGDWSDALRYPGLREFFASLEQQPAEVLAPMVRDPEVVNEATEELIATLNPTGAPPPGASATVMSPREFQRRRAQVQSVRRHHAGGI